jgi:hypothetical protein
MNDDLIDKIWTFLHPVERLRLSCLNRRIYAKVYDQKICWHMLQHMVRIFFDYKIHSLEKVHEVVLEKFTTYTINEGNKELFNEINAKNGSGTDYAYHLFILGEVCESFRRQTTFFNYRVLMMLNYLVAYSFRNKSWIDLYLDEEQMMNQNVVFYTNKHRYTRGIFDILNDSVLFCVPTLPQDKHKDEILCFFHDNLKKIAPQMFLYGCPKINYFYKRVGQDTVRTIQSKRGKIELKEWYECREMFHTILQKFKISINRNNYLLYQRKRSLQLTKALKQSQNEERKATKRLKFYVDKEMEQSKKKNI